MELGKLVDAAIRLQAKHREAQAKADDIGKKLAAAKNELQSALEGARLDKCASGHGAATIHRETVPNVQDWDKVYDFIRKNDAFELLHRRMTAAAWRERYEAGEVVPGTEAFKNVTVRLTTRLSTKG